MVSLNRLATKSTTNSGTQLLSGMEIVLVTMTSSNKPLDKRSFVGDAWLAAVGIDRSGSFGNHYRWAEYYYPGFCCSGIGWVGGCG